MLGMFRRRKQAAPAPVRVDPPRLAIRDAALGAMQQPKWTQPAPLSRVDIFRPAQPAPGVAPPEMAMDYSPAQEWAAQGAYGEGLAFVGYPYLAELGQRPEYRRISETIAEEMTRKWVVLKAKGDADKTDVIDKLTDAMTRFRLQEAFHRAAWHDGMFGIGHIYVDTGAAENPDELKTPLVRDRRKIKRGSLKGFVNVEPIWCYPNDYNSTDPLDPDFYKPRSWFVQGKQVHRTRLLTFVGREVSDLLKPAYQFGGLSKSQTAAPYVQNWLRTRQSVSDLLHSFSVSGLKTNMQTILNGGNGDDLAARANLFNITRDDRGLMLLDKETEEFFNVSTPLSTLDHLQAQAQEQMASVAGIPLVKLLGITPSGLNASSDGEIRVFYDHIAAYQEKLFRSNLQRALEIIMVSELGAVDPDVRFEFPSLWELDEATQATVDKTEAETHMIYVDMGAVAPDTVRDSLAADQNSAYHGLDLASVAPPPDDTEQPSLETDPPA